MSEEQRDALAESPELSEQKLENGSISDQGGSTDNEDDLFGEGSDASAAEDGDEGDNGSSEDSGSRRSRGTGHGLGAEDNEEQEMYNRKFYGDDLQQASDLSDDDEAREIREADLELVKHVVPYYTTSHSEQETIYYTKVPQFLTIDPVPFDPPSFQAQIEKRMTRFSSKEDQLGDSLIDENTIRWRYSRGSDQRVFKESNAQVIEWSDGTLSLKLGDEYTDILTNEIENTYLTVSHEQQEIMQCVEGGTISNSMLFIPTSTNSKIHKRLTKAIARREAREHSGPSTYIVRKDPELEKKELQKKHDQVLRERRKRQLKEQLDRDNLEGGLAQGSFEFKKAAGRAAPYSRSMEDEYDDEDGFIDDDDDLDALSDNDDAADSLPGSPTASQDEEDDKCRASAAAEARGRSQVLRAPASLACR
ncbi:AaceriACL167Cp [[Ashbya] aceris (nom. inval.)]|nr:AaceriACL167Cp [[Ashbya] aceris (nom. inval.)]